MYVYYLSSKSLSLSLSLFHAASFNNQISIPSTSRHYRRYPDKKRKFIEILLKKDNILPSSRQLFSPRVVSAGGTESEATILPRNPRVVS